MKSRRTKATEIPADVKKRVEERDSIDGHPCCIFCGSPNARGEGHIVSRAHNGKGIEQNLITVCRECHGRMDNSQARNLYLTKAVNYIKQFYPDWTPESVTYNKWDFLKGDLTNEKNNL